MHAVLYCTYVLVFVLFTMEVFYRYQVIDFYGVELNAVNPKETLTDDDGKKTILVCGDSFTVQAQSWADQMRSSLPEYNIINSAITGTSIVETSYVAPGRIKTFNPDVFIYQVYVGNDLLGISHQLNWRDWSLLRNMYWWLSDKIHVLAYLNYKTGQWKWSLFSNENSQPASAEALKDSFDINIYRQREKIYAQGDPSLISNSVLLKNGREQDMAYLLESLDEIISNLKLKCQVYVLIIPHKAQLNEAYLKNMADVGFRFEDEFKTGNTNYPFSEALAKHYRDNSSVKIIDPLHSLVLHDSGLQKMYLLNDEHLAVAGQTIVKDAVLKSLQER
jgi:hypothetical protein